MYLMCNNTKYLLEKEFIFPGGELQVQIPQMKNSSEINIHAKLISSDSIIKLVLVKEALDYNYPFSIVNLHCHYFPYARQDRACDIRESYSLKAISKLIGSLNFNSITVADLHSENENTRLFNEITSLDIFRLNSSMLDGIDYLVAPDKGATKKVINIGKEFGLPVIQAEKVRNPRTGEITGIDIIANKEKIQESNLLVIDDICDGGKTFTELHKLLWSSNSVSLYITHGIFSKGIDALRMYNKVYTTDSFCKIKNNNLEVIKL